MTSPTQTILQSLRSRPVLPLIKVVESQTTTSVESRPCSLIAIAMLDNELANTTMDLSPKPDNPWWVLWTGVGSFLGGIAALIGSLASLRKARAERQAITFSEFDAARLNALEESNSQLTMLLNDAMARIENRLETRMTSFSHRLSALERRSGIPTGGD